eukprot:scaffold633_cov134-Isochrysis_galbana.AAC.5
MSLSLELLDTVLYHCAASPARPSVAAKGNAPPSDGPDRRCVMDSWSSRLTLHGQRNIKGRFMQSLLECCPALVFKADLGFGRSV